MGMTGESPFESSTHLTDRQYLWSPTSVASKGEEPVIQYSQTTLLLDLYW
jgi:hypothetical protein